MRVIDHTGWASRWRWQLVWCLGYAACNQESIGTLASVHHDAGAGASAVNSGAENGASSVDSQPEDGDPLTSAGDGGRGTSGGGENSAGDGETENVPTGGSDAVGPTAPPGTRGDAGLDAGSELVAAERAVVCPSVDDSARGHSLALVATDGEEAVFVRSNGEERRAPFPARSAMEVWGVEHFALLSPGTSWAAVVVSRDGTVVSHASGAFSQFHDNFRVRELSLDADGTLTADYGYQGYDWEPAGPVQDLVVFPGGEAREVLIADVDDQGFTPYENGLAHVTTGELIEAPDSGAQFVHFRRGGRWTGVYLASRDEGLELVVLDAQKTRSFPPGPDLPAPRTLTAVGEDAVVVSRSAADGVPVVHFDLTNERVTELVPASTSNDFIGESNGTSYVVLDSSDFAPRWLVDVETAVAVELTDQGEAAVTVATGVDSWFVIEDGARVQKVSRATGAVTLDIAPQGTELALAWQDHLFLVVDGTLSASLDLTTEEWTSLETGGVVVDDLIGFADGVVATRAGLPVLRLELGSSVAETIDAPPSDEAVTHEVFPDWMLFLAQGRPHFALSREGVVSTFVDGAGDAPEAETITLDGNWAFGLQRSPGDALGTQSIVWRANLSEDSLEVVPEPAGYAHLFDARFQLGDPADLSTAPDIAALTDRGYSDGQIAVLRRDAASSHLLSYGLDGEWTLIGDAMPSVFNLSVTRGEGFFAIEQADWNCFCPPPELSWEPTDLPPAPLRQLVLTTTSPFTVLRQESLGGTLSIHPSGSCVAWTDELGSLVVDGPSGEILELQSGMEWRWLVE
jgi:hypothetical protein